ncbi:DUF1129 domain-containing protein [Streptococcus cameli]
MQLNELTKKNQEFIHIATTTLINNGKSDAEIKALLEDILPTILENQKKGITARGAFGAPSEWANKISNPEPKEQIVEENDNPWLMWLDASLLIMALLGFVNGVMNLFNQGTPYGILTFLVISFGVGAGIYLMYHFVYRHMGDSQKRPKTWKAILLLLLATSIWSIIFFLATMIPVAINPILPPLAMLLLAAAAFGVRYYLKKKYNIRNAMQPVR